MIDRGIEYQKLAEGLNGIYPMINELEHNMKNELKSEYSLIEDLLVLTYIMTRSVFDRIEKYQYPLTTNIYVPLISSSKISLDEGLKKTFSRLINIADEMGQMNEFDEILNKGDWYWQLDSEIPNEIKDNL